MDNIKIIRLQDGYDIICGLNKQEDNYELISPMIFHLKGQQLMMQHWLPISLVKENKTTIKESDILCIADPSLDFTEYYTNTVEKVKELIQARDLLDDINSKEISDIKMQEILNELEELKHEGHPLH